MKRAAENIGMAVTGILCIPVILLALVFVGVRTARRRLYEVLVLDWTER